MASQLLAVSYISLSRPDILPCVECRQYLSFPVCCAQRIAPNHPHISSTFCLCWLPITHLALSAMLVAHCHERLSHERSCCC